MGAGRTRAGRAAAKPGRAGGEHGFTVVEVLVAGTLGLGLALPAFALLNGTYRVATLLNSRFARDAEARQVLTLLGEGSSSFGTVTDPRGFTMVEGLRSHASIPSPYTLTSNGQFVMGDLAPVSVVGINLGGILGVSGSGPTLSGDAVPSTTITCTASGVPVPACGYAGATVTTQGWMGASPTLQTFGLAAPGTRTVAVEVTVSDPFQATRPGRTAADVTDTYRTLFNLNVEANP